MPRAQPKWVEIPAASLSCSDGRIREAISVIESALSLVKDTAEYVHIKYRTITRSRFHEEERLLGSAAGQEESGAFFREYTESFEGDSSVRLQFPPDAKFCMGLVLKVVLSWRSLSRWGLAERTWTTCSDK